MVVQSKSFQPKAPDVRSIVSAAEEGDSMFGEQFAMMGVETPVKQEGEGRGVVEQPGSSVKGEGGESLVPRYKQEMLLMLASSVGEDCGGGLLSESQHQAPHLAHVNEGGLLQAAYNAYDEQEVQVLCRAPPSSLSKRAPLGSFSEEELLSSSHLERDNLGFYTEHPTPEKHLMERYIDDYLKLSNLLVTDHCSIVCGCAM